MCCKRFLFILFRNNRKKKINTAIEKNKFYVELYIMVKFCIILFNDSNELYACVFPYALEMLEKRIGANSEGWYDTPITENVVGGAELHPTAGGKKIPTHEHT